MAVMVATTAARASAPSAADCAVYLDAVGGDDTRTCASADQACATLSKAFAVVDSRQDALSCEISLAAGTYAGELNRGQKLTIGDQHHVTMHGPENGENRVILDGGGMARVLEVTTSNTTGNAFLALSFVTIENGMTNGNGGGLLLNAGVQLIATNVRFLQNTANSGGGLYVLDDTLLSNAVFQDNTAMADVMASPPIDGAVPGGGAVHGETGASVYIADSRFENNKAEKSYGGALNLLGRPDTGPKQNLVFSQNRAWRGGALYLSEAEKGDESTYDALRFEENHADFGGAIYLSDSIGAQFSELICTKNTATHSGGCVYSERSATDFDDKFDCTLNKAVQGHGGCLFLTGVTTERGAHNNITATDISGKVAQNLCDNDDQSRNVFCNATVTNFRTLNHYEGTVCTDKCLNAQRRKPCFATIVAPPGPPLPINDDGWKWAVGIIVTLLIIGAAVGGVFAWRRGMFAKLMGGGSRSLYDKV